MSDNEIKKALECCTDFKCENCPCEDNSEFTCTEILMEDALDLINRQQAEIERLQKLLDDKCDKCIARDRAEAIKEFADKLKSQFHISCDYTCNYVRAVINDLVKEMTEVKADDKR